MNPCPYCDRRFESEWGLHIHISVKHPEKKSPINGMSEEHKERISRSVKKWIEENGHSMEGYNWSDEQRERMSRNLKEAMNRPEVKEAISKNCGMKRKEVREKMSKTRKKRIAEGKIKINGFKKGHKFPPSIERRRIKNIVKALMKRPTSLEEDFIRLCEEHELPFKYVGDGSFWVGRKNPDFIHKKKETRFCVEVSNRVNRDEESYAKPRKEAFRRSGWKCLVFFGDNKLEKTDSEIVEDIRRALGKSVETPLFKAGAVLAQPITPPRGLEPLRLASSKSEWGTPAVGDGL